ncbi:MAG TPA: hypothetical protein VNO54_17690 [Streptosporangiaceae bacterium]|nr:hypothetical protein [Streptosporangiaceae bacterium]
MPPTVLPLPGSHGTETEQQRGLMAAVAITATTGVNHTPAHVYLAGIAFNALD